MILVIEDDDKMRTILVSAMRDQGWAAAGLSTAEEALAWIDDPAQVGPDLLLVDVRLAGSSTGIDLIRQLQGEKRLPPTVVLSGEASVTEAIEALKLGVYDFLEKPVSREKLARTVANCLEHARMQDRIAELSRAAQRSESGLLIGESSAIRELRRQIERVAANDATVLIRGESGTGKELVASAIHRSSRRSARAFVKVNCAAIPATLIESELFGHARGSFTDARVARAGLFEEADGGTLFLDEIGDMPFELQSRLLRVLEERKVRRVGESLEKPVDVRIIAATNRDLEQLVAERAFREDIFYRLSAIPIEVPPLRAHPEDVPLLFGWFLESFCRRQGRRPIEIDPGVLPLLRAYRWPGNVRELKNVCERLAVFARDPLTSDQLPATILEPSGAPELETGRLASTGSIVPLREFRSECEREYITSVLERTGWNFTEAARLLGIQRTYLHEKAANLGIRRGEGGS